MPRRKSQGIGDAISTFTFLLFALLLAFASLLDTGLKSFVLGLCSIASLLAAFRFQIARLVQQFFR